MISPENEAFNPDLYLDIFYDYKKFIQDQIGTVPASKLGTKVAIVGAGAAGLMAARLLLEVGLEPVIYEASDRYGGRLYTKHFTDENGPVPAFAELGAMRIPLSSQIFFHFADKFKMNTDMDFPDPGLVDTLLSYQNQKFFWKAGEPVPEHFATVKKNWEMLVTPLIEKITTPWRLGDLETAKKVWQNYIEHYKGVSFYDAIRMGSPVWADDELNRFGTLGIGTGGFGPLYHIGFIELLRIMLHKWENNQKLITEGVGSFVDHLVNDIIETPSGPQKIGTERIHLNHKVRRIEIENGHKRVVIENNGAETSELYSAVIVATTTRAMQYMGLTLNTEGQKPIFDKNIETAIRKLHLLNSSKLFIRTKDKFWKHHKNMPLTVLTDEIASGTYLLDYPQTKNGVVCVSYSWGDDSAKVSGIEPKERLRLYIESLKSIAPELAKHLIPVNDEIIHIDWQTEDNYFGAFKLNLPGQEDDAADLFFQFQSVNDPNRDTGIYLAGDSVSWSGGWVEGALQTAVNAACSALKHIGGDVKENSPLDIPSDRYNYL